MKKYIHLAITVVLCSIALISCIKDESSVPTDNIPHLKIKGIGEDMPVYNFDLGDVCVIQPEVSYTNGNTSDLKYEWSVGTFEDGVKGKLEKISTEAVFKHKFLKGGSYYVHLVITDGKVGQVADYRVNINRSFEEGHILVSKDASGRGNLSFVKTLTPEEIAQGKKTVIVQHCLETMNEGVASEDNLIACTIGTVTWPKQLTRLMVAMTDRCYFVDPNTMTILAETKFTDVFPEFRADIFMPDEYSPYVYSKTSGKYVHLELTYMFPYEYKYFKGAPFEDFYECKFTAWGSPRTMTLFVDYTRSLVCRFNAYNPNTYFPGTGELLKGKEIINVFSGTTQSPANYVTPVYILTQNTDHLVLYKNDKDNTMDARSFTTQEMQKSEGLAVPERGMKFQPSPKYHRYFYYIGSRIYVFVPGTEFTVPRREQFAIDFGASEEVTCIQTDISKELLYVGTFDKTSGKGNFYIYNTSDVSTNNQGNISPVEVHKACADRITSIIHKPRISS